MTAIAVAVAAAAMPAAAWGQQAGITYDCDTAADHFSDLVLPAPAAPFAVTGRVRLNRPAPINQYVPLTRIVVGEAPSRPGEGPTAHAGFELSALPAKLLNRPGNGDLQFLRWDASTGGQGEPFGPLTYDDALPFTIVYDGKNVIAQVAGQERRTQATFAHPVVRIVCSTAEYLFTDLIIAKAG